MSNSISLLLLALFGLGFLAHFGAFLSYGQMQKNRFPTAAVVLLAIVPVGQGQFYCLGRAFYLLQDAPILLLVALGLFSVVVLPWSIIFVVYRTLQNIAEPFTIREFAWPALKYFLGLDLDERQSDIVYTALHKHEQDDDETEPSAIQ